MGIFRPGNKLPGCFQLSLTGQGKSFPKIVNTSVQKYFITDFRKDINHYVSFQGNFVLIIFFRLAGCGKP
ncbi:MAG: hypothetical protein DRI57_21455 [Deltaproteobacteria bacterium]|nr:MAG: hypothetical protein DRI57_21455 [Deltaproteobacteria bacterium]